jgi:uracil-DNA glycosylase family protein
MASTGTRPVPSGPPAAPHPRSLSEAREEARTCRRCDLWRRGTQTVFGEGRKKARFMLVGEQPGDVEDKAGEPFVGPAGQLLRDALAEAGIALGDVYLTNAVKHFKWEPRGKRRIHAKPDRTEVLACRVWLEAEIAFVKPRAIVALGATAAAAMLGPGVRVTRDRARPIESPLAPFVTVTVHPSSILRAPDSDARAAARAQFVADLRAIAKRVP